jgi:hypothetical protein
LIRLNLISRSSEATKQRSSEAAPQAILFSSAPQAILFSSAPQAINPFFISTASKKNTAASLL